MFRRFFSSSARRASSLSSYHVDPTDTAHSVKKIGIIGAGQMGIGIALVAAQTAQIPVLVLDSNENQLAKQMKFLGTTSCLLSSHLSHIHST